MPGQMGLPGERFTTDLTVWLNRYIILLVRKTWTPKGVFFYWGINMTAADILTDVKNLIGPGIETNDVGLLAWVNESYLYICDEIVKVLPDFFTKVVATPTVADQQEYELPDDFDKMIMLNVAYNSTDWYRALPLPNIGFIQVHASSTIQHSQSDPRYYISGNYLGLSPIPTDAGTINNIKMWYVYNPAELESSDTPSIPTKYQSIIKYGAYANYLDQDDEHVAAERVRNYYDQRIYKMIEQLEVRQIDEPKSVEIVQNQDMYEA